MRLIGFKILCCFFLSNIVFGYAQQNMEHLADTLPKITGDNLTMVPDTLPMPAVTEPAPLDTSQIERIVIVDDTISLPTTLEVKAFKPDPKRAVIYSAIFPGLGQVYNRKYWKLPIIYGGFIGFTYAISWNGRYYADYSNGYKDIMGDDPTKDSWKNFLPYGQDPETVDKVWLKDVMKRRRDFYRRYRDLSIIGTVAMYALAMVDAYVDAQLFDFEISPDLSFRVEPTIIEKTDYFANSFGVQWSISF